MMATSLGGLFGTREPVAPRNKSAATRGALGSPPGKTWATPRAAVGATTCRGKPFSKRTQKRGVAVVREACRTHKTSATPRAAVGATTWWADCVGVAVVRHPSHDLRAHGAVPVWYCARCGATTAREGGVLKGLAKPCRPPGGQLSRPRGLARLAQGFWPGTSREGRAWNSGHLLREGRGAGREWRGLLVALQLPWLSPVWGL